MSVTLDVRDDGFMILRSPGTREVQIYLPILKNRTLDGPEGYSPDVLYASLKHVPSIKDIFGRFRQCFSNFHHVDTDRMVAVLDYTRNNLLYNLFDPDNPGHVFVAMQCFGGWWAGVATQAFATTLLEMCNEIKDAMEKAAGIMHSKSGKEIDMMMGVVACICKSFGCSARTPIIPHCPSGSPPDPVVLLADAICAKYPYFKKSNVRDNLLRALRDWHIPKYMRLPNGKHRQQWLPQNHIDRTRAFMEMSFSSNIWPPPPKYQSHII